MFQILLIFFLISTASLCELPPCFFRFTAKNVSLSLWHALFPEEELLHRDRDHVTLVPFSCEEFIDASFLKFKHLLKKRLQDSRCCAIKEMTDASIDDVITKMLSVTYKAILHTHEELKNENLTQYTDAEQSILDLITMKEKIEEEIDEMNRIELIKCFVQILFECEENVKIALQKYVPDEFDNYMKLIEKTKESISQPYIIEHSEVKNLL